jgi:hypothetical protein
MHYLSFVSAHFQFFSQIVQQKYDSLIYIYKITIFDINRYTGALLLTT